jgi:hypothetical protein
MKTRPKLFLPKRASEGTASDENCRHGSPLVSLAVVMKVSSVAMNTDFDSNSTLLTAFINLCFVIPHTRV